MRSILIIAVLLVSGPVFINAQIVPWKIEIQDTNGSLTEASRKMLKSLTLEAQQELHEVFPTASEEITVMISLDSAGTIQETGNSGFPLSSKAISFKINPYHNLGIDNIISKYYKTTIYHEFNHIVRGWTAISSRESNNFMDAVIAEGLATIFEVEFAKNRPLWADYPEDVENWVEELLTLPPSAYREYGKWMFKHPDGRKWIGYKSGSYLIERAMKHSSKSIIELTTISTEDLLRLAGYK